MVASLNGKAQLRQEPAEGYVLLVRMPYGRKIWWEFNLRIGCEFKLANFNLVVCFPPSNDVTQDVTPPDSLVPPFEHWLLPLQVLVSVNGSVKRDQCPHFCKFFNYFLLSYLDNPCNP